MSTRPPRVSTIALHPAEQPCYGFWTKVVRNNDIPPVPALSLLTAWLTENTVERVVIGHTWIYFENNKDATFFNLTH